MKAAVSHEGLHVLRVVQSTLDGSEVWCDDQIAVQTG